MAHQEDVKNMPKSARKTPGRPIGVKQLSEGEREQMVEEYKQDPMTFCVKLFASHDGDYAWWEKNWELIPEKLLLENYIITAEGTLRAELEPYQDHALIFLQHRYPKSFHGLLVKYGATARPWDDGWLFEYRFPFDATIYKPGDEKSSINPRDPCPVPSLLLELEYFIDEPQARLYYGETNASRLTGEERHWKQFWGSYSFTELFFLKYNLFQFFLLMKTYAIQVIQMGLDTFRHIRALMREDFTHVLQSAYRHEKNQDTFFAALRQFDPPRADRFARELAWNYIQTMTIDNFDTDFAHLEANYGLVEAFLKDEADLLRFLQETRSLPLRDALQNLGSQVPAKVLRYMRDPAWLRKKQGTDWKSIKKKMGLDEWEEPSGDDSFDEDDLDEYPDLDF